MRAESDKINDKIIRLGIEISGRENINIATLKIGC
jgi:hypothetical protein